MTKVRTNADWGNSPKNRLIQELTVAMVRADARAAGQLVTEGIEWTYIGRRPVVGVKEFCRALARYGPASTLTIDHVIAHGNSGAVDGVIEFGTKVSALTSYSIPLKPE